MQEYMKEMAAHVAVLKESIESLKKEKKELKNAPDLTPADIEREKLKIESRIQKNKDAMKLYDIKKVELRKTGAYVINMKVYQEFLKKIKGMYYTIQVGHLGVELRYGKTHELNEGILVFYNQAERYATIKNIPELEEVVTLGQTEIA